jgi:hypothetical protein
MPEEGLRVRITAAIRTVDMVKSSGEVTGCQRSVKTLKFNIHNNETRKWQHVLRQHRYLQGAVLHHGVTRAKRVF